MTLNDTMQHYTTVYKTIQHYNYKDIWHHMTPYRLYDNVRHYIQRCTTLYTTLYKTI